MGIRLSNADRHLKKLVALGLAEDLGRTCLSPQDHLYGRYYFLKNSKKLDQYVQDKVHFRFKAPLRTGREKTVSFSGGREVARHLLFALHSTFWVADFFMRGLESVPVAYYSEAALRHTFGWHGNMGPSKNAANPKPTMVPDGLVAVNNNNIRIEAEMTPKSAKTYEELFSKIAKKDDVVFYVFPDGEVKNDVESKLPSGYKVGGVIFGDEQGLRALVKKLLPSLAVLLFEKRPSL